MIIRRLVGGILLLVMALFELILFHSYYVEYLADSRLAAAAFMLRYLIFGIWAIVLGIIYIVTCKRRPIKWQELTLEIISVVLVFIFSGRVTYLSENSLFYVVVFFQLVLQVVACPGKNGFKDYPYVVKDRGNDSQSIDSQSIDSQSIDSQSIEKLTKLKELLDSGAITQEEFDQEKKKILK